MTFYAQIIYNFDVSFGVDPNGDDILSVQIPSSKAHRAAATADDPVFYGTTVFGGDNDNGTVYSITGSGSHTVLYQFGDQTDDGANPVAGLVEGNDGNLYGTTPYGGANSLGTVFYVTPTGMLTTLHSFAGTGDGIQPKASLTLGNDGNLYGTTTFAAQDPQLGPSGNGTLFSITPLAATPSVLTTLHTFASDGSEGGQPMASLLLASDGNFYGTTSSEGIAGGAVNGTLSAFSPTTGTFTNLHTFVPSSTGAQPVAPLIQGTDGNLYGTTSSGGTNYAGVVFKVRPECHGHANSHPDAYSDCHAHAHAHP